MSFRLTFLWLILAATLLEVAADIFFKKWALAGRLPFALIGFGLYFTGTVFWAVSLRYDYLARAISVFTVLNLIAVALVGVMLFEEHLSTANKIGIALGVLSMVLIEA